MAYVALSHVRTLDGVYLTMNHLRSAFKKELSQYDVPLEKSGKKRHLTGTSDICTIKTKKPKLVKSIVKVSGKKRKRDASAISVDQNKRKKNVKSVQQSSWEGFRYFPIDEEWQRSCCSQLNLNFYSTYKKSKGDGNTILTRPNMRTIKGIRGDGNCLFRVLSFVLTGSQEQHPHVRLLICSHMHSIPHLLQAHISPCTSTYDYINQTGMHNNGTWGTDIEIFTFANLCQTNVYVYDTENGLLNVFPPSVSLIDFDVSTKSVHLLHPTGHFDVVTSVRKI